jgi:hypothetical protein
MTLVKVVHRQRQRQAERGTRQSRGGVKWGLAAPFDVKATDKGDRGGGHGGGAAWAAHGVEAAAGRQQLARLADNTAAAAVRAARGWKSLGQ